jgi:hypothetical protein
MSDHEHVCGACGATTRERMPEQPRVWRSGDAEPGDDVRAVLGASGVVLTRESYGWLTPGDEDSTPWRLALMFYGPLVEVTLPEPVRE